MTLQQLRYLIAIAENGSISAAANSIYASQSNLSIAIRDLEKEFGITIFTRSNRGVTLTNEGTELLAYARQVVEQADMLENRFTKKATSSARLAVSAQHYAFSVRAFINVAERCAAFADAVSRGDRCLNCPTGGVQPCDLLLLLRFNR